MWLPRKPLNINEVAALAYSVHWYFTPLNYFYLHKYSFGIMEVFLAPIKRYCENTSKPATFLTFFDTTFDFTATKTTFSGLFIFKSKRVCCF